MTSGGGGRVQKDGITREVYGKVAVWMGQPEIRSGIFEKIRKKLEEVERG